MHRELTDALHGAGIHACSLSSDGTETERKLQSLIAKSAHSTLDYRIANGTPSYEIELKIPVYHGIPAVIVQDSKHALKTSRNQIFTGARMLAMGNFPIYYSQLLDFAMHPLGPLFLRDVQKADRQDDRAAARFASSESLDFALTQRKDDVGLAVYLFVFGELVDAWQNRNISHIKRARMVMRARFFLMAWRTHVIAHDDHAVHINFISRESYDIFLTLCDSLLSLIVVYRKYYPTYPLLPWLHSTEPCEHLFGVLRQLKKDFNYQDMLYLEPKLRTLMLGAFGDLVLEDQLNQTAAGYHHTYFHAVDLDTEALMQWPTDFDIQNASAAAMQEAEDLLGAVGIDGSAMLKTYAAPVFDTRDKDRDLTGSSDRPQTLHEILLRYANLSMSSDVEDKVETCELALIADDVDRTAAM